jgi:hypothetical protein
MHDSFSDVSVALGDSVVGTVEIHGPPDDYIDLRLSRLLADALEAVENDGARGTDIEFPPTPPWARSPAARCVTSEREAAG